MLRSRVARTIACLCFVAAAAVVPTAAQSAAPPAAPTGVKITPTSNAATITWNKASDATRYDLCLFSSGTATQCSHWGQTTSNSYNFTGLKPTGGRDWYVRITAFNSAGRIHSQRIGFDLSSTPTPGAPPAVPTNISTVPTSNAATVSWAKATDSTRYDVCLFSSGTSATCEHLRQTTGTSVNFTGLTPTGGTDWFVRVTAFNSAGRIHSPRVGFDLSSTPSAPPAVPTNISTVPTSNAATVSWAKATDATRYDVCLFSSGTSATCEHLRQTTGTSVNFTGLTPTGGTDWFVRVTAFNSAGRIHSQRIGFDLTAGSTPTTPPATPSGVRISPTSNAATVTWNTATDTTRYDVCLFSSGTSTTCEHLRQTTGTSVNFTGLTPTGGTDWYVRITAFNSVGRVHSQRLPFDLLAGTIPSTPTIRSVVQAPQQNAFSVDWTDSTPVTSYELQLSKSAAMESPTTLRVNASAAVVNDLAWNYHYFVRVRALNDASASPWSATVKRTVEPSPAAVSVVTWNLCGQNKCGGAVQSWNSVRKPVAGQFMRSLDVDIIATQESHERDTKFETELPGYGLAAYRSAKSLYYDIAKYGLIRRGTMTLNASAGKYAVWAEFESKQSGARFMVVDAHLSSGKGKTQDDVRKREVTKMVQEINGLNPAHRPVVYAGDFNSNSSNAGSKYPGGYDAPRQVFAAYGVKNSLDLTPSANRIHADYNSANQSKNPPYRYGHHVDAIYVEPGFDINRWQMPLQLASNGYYAMPWMTDHNPIVVDLTVPIP